MRKIELPRSGARIEVEEDFSQQKAAAKVREMLDDPEAARRFQQDPTSALAELGVKIRGGDLSRVSMDELMEATGARPRSRTAAAGEAEAAVNPVALAAILLLVLPGPAE